jgi:hypothetical protein
MGGGGAGAQGGVPGICRLQKTEAPERGSHLFKNHDLGSYEIYNYSHKLVN